MRRDAESGELVPGNLTEYLDFFQGVKSITAPGEELRKNVVSAIRTLIDNVEGGGLAEPTLNHRQFCDMVIQNGIDLFTQREQHKADIEPSRELVSLAAMAVTVGSREAMLKLAEQIELKSKHPSVHPDRAKAALKVSAWLRMNADASARA